jgi:hypothetical protein
MLFPSARLAGSPMPMTPQSVVMPSRSFSSAAATSPSGAMRNSSVRPTAVQGARIGG